MLYNLSWRRLALSEAGLQRALLLIHRQLGRAGFHLQEQPRRLALAHRRVRPGRERIENP